MKIITVVLILKCCICCHHTDYGSFKVPSCGHTVYLGEYHSIYFYDILCDHDNTDDDDDNDPPAGATASTYGSAIEGRSYREILLMRHLSKESSELSSVQRIAANTSPEVDGIPDGASSSSDDEPPELEE